MLTNLYLPLTTPGVLFSANGNTAVKQVLLTNNDSVSRKATIHLVPTGDGPTNQNRIIIDEDIPAGKTFSLEGIILGDGDSVQGQSDVASMIGCTITTLAL